jgi:hypothetical protein
LVYEDLKRDYDEAEATYTTINNAYINLMAAYYNCDGVDANGVACDEVALQEDADDYFYEFWLDAYYEMYYANQYFAPVKARVEARSAASDEISEAERQEELEESIREDYNRAEDDYNEYYATWEVDYYGTTDEAEEETLN